MPCLMKQARNAGVPLFDIFTSEMSSFDTEERGCYMQVAEDASLSMSGAGQRG